MKTSSSFVTVCVLLAGSVLLNLILLSRTEEPVEARPKAAPARPAPVAEPLAKTPDPVFLPAPVPRTADVSLAPSASEALQAARTTAAPVRPVVQFDPSVEAVLDAQDKFGAFWKEIDRVFRAKDRLEEARYFQAVVGATQEFLELSEPRRSQFAEAARMGSLELGRARKERDEARLLLPARDKNNPASNAAYQQQKDAVDLRYDQRVKAAVSSLTSVLEAGRPRHAEFSGNADKWLRNLVPKTIP